MIYSHGQADRVRTTQQDSQAKVSKLTQALSAALIVQDYAATSGVKLLSFSPLQPLGGSSILSVMTAPRDRQGVLAARRLPVLQSGQFYAVWGRRQDSHYELLGTFVPGSRDASVAQVLEGTLSLDLYSAISINIESRPAIQSPSSAMIWAVRPQQGS
jgi:hypothetical protein